MEIRAAVGEGRSIYTLTLLYYVLYVFILYSSTLPATVYEGGGREVGSAEDHRSLHSERPFTVGMWGRHHSGACCASMLGAFDLTGTIGPHAHVFRSAGTHRN